MESPSYFVKRGSPANLEAERSGLDELRRGSEIHRLSVPRVLKLTSNEMHLELIRPVTPSASDWSNFGSGLARLHSLKSREFGFTTDNFIGLNRQVNGWWDNWGQFFVERRLGFQISLVTDSDRQKLWASHLAARRKTIVERLNAHYPSPSLLHGDLWSGNIMFDSQRVWIIDPAVYYGDPETDLAMTHVFGGFDPEFYSAYANEHKPAPGATERASIYNLYHYLNHFNLFGTAYLKSVEAGMSLL